MNSFYLMLCVYTHIPIQSPNMTQETETLHVKQTHMAYL